jgi:hypothetical protein
LGISPSEKQMGGSPRLAGITASAAAHPFFPGRFHPKPARNAQKGAPKSLSWTILANNSNVFNGLEQMIQGTSPSF